MYVTPLRASQSNEFQSDQQVKNYISGCLFFIFINKLLYTLTTGRINENKMCRTKKICHPAFKSILPCGCCSCKYQISYRYASVAELMKSGIHAPLGARTGRCELVRYFSDLLVLVRCGASFWKFLWCWCGAVRIFEKFSVLVRCGPGFRNFWATGAVRCEIFWAIIIGHLIFNLVDYGSRLNSKIKRLIRWS